jgi:hypothetical protein
MMLSISLAVFALFNHAKFAEPKMLILPNFNRNAIILNEQANDMNSKNRILSDKIGNHIDLLESAICQLIYKQSSNTITETELRKLNMLNVTLNNSMEMKKTIDSIQVNLYK